MNPPLQRTQTKTQQTAEDKKGGCEFKKERRPCSTAGEIRWERAKRKGGIPQMEGTRRSTEKEGGWWLSL